MKILLIFSVFVLGCARDQVLPSAFKVIFPYASEKDVIELTFETNLKSSPLLAIFYMMDWIPNHFKAPNVKLNTTDKLSDKQFAQNQASDFLNHRGAVRKFLQYIYKETLDKKYFKEKEAMRMREIYWSSDLISEHNFSKTRALFKNRTAEEFAKTHKDFGVKLDNMTSTYYYMHISTAEKLNWTLSKY